MITEILMVIKDDLTGSSWTWYLFGLVFLQ